MTAFNVDMPGSITAVADRTGPSGFYEPFEESESTEHQRYALTDQQFGTSLTRYPSRRL